MQLVSWALSDTGQRRAQNEDSYLVDTNMGLFAVADGMGGHKGGARASSLALEVLHSAVGEAVDDVSAAAQRLRELANRRWVEDGEVEDAATRQTAEISLRRPEGMVAEGPESIERFPPAMLVMQLAARKASSVVFREAALDPSLQGMGTTMTAMLCESGRMHLVHAGDSRAYLFRDGSVRQLTEDHSWTAEQIRAGLMTEEEAAESDYKHVITRSIGFERDVEVDSYGVVVQSGDCFVLCSDGLSNYLEPGELEALMAGNWYSRLPQILVDLANDRGGDDNITVVVVYAANQVEGWAE